MFPEVPCKREGVEEVGELVRKWGKRREEGGKEGGEEMGGVGRIWIIILNLFPIQFFKKWIQEIKT